MNDATRVVSARDAALEQVLAALADAERPVLTTHVNADGDGAGSEAAVAAWLAQRGQTPTIVNPTGYPSTFRHLLDSADRAADPGSARGRRALEEADLFVVLDTGVADRIGRIHKAIRGRPVVVIDHHPPAGPGLGGVAVQDPGACATGELVYDLFRIAGWTGSADWPPLVAEALYTAIVTDTGSFRYSNTTSRAHRITAELIERGVDPEKVYRHIFATVPLRRLQILRVALEHLRVDPDLPLTWITIPPGTVEAYDGTSDDLDGIIEHARTVEGTEIAAVFRTVPDGATKVSLRSNGTADVNAIAHRFGGGGHVKAAGALIGESIEHVEGQVLDAARAALRALEQGSGNG